MASTTQWCKIFHSFHIIRPLVRGYSIQRGKYFKNCHTHQHSCTTPNTPHLQNKDRKSLVAFPPIWRMHIHDLNVLSYLANGKLLLSNTHKKWKRISNTFLPRPFYPETPFRSFCISTPTTVPRIRVVTLFFSILLRIHWFVAWCCCCCELVELNCREDSSYDTTHTQKLAQG